MIKIKLLLHQKTKKILQERTDDEYVSYPYLQNYFLPSSPPPPPAQYWELLDDVLESDKDLTGWRGDPLLYTLEVLGRPFRYGPWILMNYSGNIGDHGATSRKTRRRARKLFKRVRKLINKARAQNGLQPFNWKGYEDAMERLESEQKIKKDKKGDIMDATAQSIINYGRKHSTKGFGWSTDPDMVI